MNKPYLCVVTGRPGSGKTTLSKALGKQLYLPVISRDELKEGYVRTFRKKHADLPDDTNKIVTNLFFETIAHLLSANVSLIAEAAFQHKIWEPQLKLLQEKCTIVLLICKVEEDRIALERFIKRGLDDPMREYFHGDNSARLARRGVNLEVSPYVEPKLDVLSIHVDTTNGYKPSIDELKASIFGSSSSSSNR